MLSRPLNEMLYQRLVLRFGDVQVANPNAEAVPYQVLTLTGSQTKYHGGEYYRVNCPWCGDSGKRLWVSYLWGMQDPETGNRHRHLINCYNEECYYRNHGRTMQLDYEVYGAMPSQIRRVTNIRKGVAPNPRTAGDVDPPGAVVPLAGLPKHHPAVQYLGVRGYDIQELSDTYKISYCEEASEQFPAMQGRIVIPVYSKGVCVGWQGRYVGDMDWKRFKVQKYYNSNQFSKSQYLYNFDAANKFQIVFLVEGVPAIWTFGAQFVSCFGSSISMPQAELLSELSREGFVVTLLDGDTWRPNQRTGRSKAEQVVHTLRTQVPERSIVIRLPDGVKPDDYTAPAMQELVAGALAERGWSGPINSLKRTQPGQSLVRRTLRNTE